MKLKVKHINKPKEAHLVEVPNGCGLAELKQALAQQVQVLPPASAADVVVSLNKKVSLSMYSFSWRQCCGLIVGLCSGICCCCPVSECSCCHLVCIPQARMHMHAQF
jgi:hypothetical protein